MAKKITVRGIPREEPDIGLFVQALIELARQQLAEERAERDAKPTPARSRRTTS